MMRTIPELISVIMANHNTPEFYLRTAIESILNQTYSNFEFIIVDDGSTDKSVEIIQTYSDSRIILIRNEKNMGLTKSLNKALKMARGEYVARMDADDICDSRRFERQVEYLKAHPNVVVCGTRAKQIGSQGENHIQKKLVYKNIPKKEIFRAMLLFGNYPNIIHSSAMFNYNLLLKYGIEYNEEYIYAQDYRMWVECSKYAECANILEFLHYVRVREGSISTAKKAIQDDCVYRIIQEQLNLLDLQLSDDLKKYHIYLLITRQPYDEKCLQWLKTIIKANRKKKIYNRSALEKIIWGKWAEIVYFGLRGVGFIEKIRRIHTLPLMRYPLLLKIWKNRKAKRLCKEI